MKKKMAIICSTDYQSYPMGGMMSFILDSIIYLKDEFDITLWGVRTEKETLDYIKVGGEMFKFKTFATVKTKKKVIPNMLKVTYGIWKFRSVILKNKYDVIYIHGIPLSFPFFNKNVKIVNHIHGMTNPFSMTANKLARNSFSIFLYEKYRNWIVRKSDLILLASDVQGHKQFSKRFFKDENKIKYLPNFADNSIFKFMDSESVRKILNIDAQEIVLVNTGRIGLQKDPILLVESFIHLVNNYGINAKLIIIGDGELRGEIEKMAERANFNSKIIITGILDRTEINLWLNAADLYVYTSHANGFPISLAEAAMCALPIVTTDVTGVHDLVVNGYSGYLVQNRNPHDIANAIEKALVKENEFSDNILKISKNFSQEVITNRIEEQILSIL